jgi:ribosomal protein L40E
LFKILRGPVTEKLKLPESQLIDRCRNMSYCSNCGNKLSEDAFFCSKCGTKTPKGAQANVKYPSDELRDAFNNAGLELEKAFTIAAREIQNAFKKARDNINQETPKQNMVVCKNCGTENSPNAIFCRNCGNKLSTT